MNIIWVPRTAWGASAATEKFIRERRSDPPEVKTEIHVHHTAAVDGDDSTPNRWDYAEAVAYMKRLQWARPDLGPLPYSENLAVSETAQTVWVFEGRGILTRGAHTGGHNVPGVGWGVFGNFDRSDVPAAAAAVFAIEQRAARYRNSGLVPNLGTVPNPRGWTAWGHRDTSTKNCPGHSLYPLLEGFSLEGDDPMPFEPIYKKWTADDVREMKAQGLFTEGVNDYWASDVGTWSHDWDHFTAVVLAAKAAQSPGGGGVSPATVDQKIAQHAANPDAHHE